MGQVATDEQRGKVPLFNGAIEIGLRAAVILNEVFPLACSLQRLVILDYLLVHSDDIPGGPTGLHPRTPHRSGELLVRRSALQEGLSLYESRGLIERKFQQEGVFYAASDRSAGFLDALGTEYVERLRDRAAWLDETFGRLVDPTLEETVRGHLGEWGAEFALESVLWAEEPS